MWVFILTLYNFKNRLPLNSSAIRQVNDQLESTGPHNNTAVADNNSSCCQTSEIPNLEFSLLLL